MLTKLLAVAGMLLIASTAPAPVIIVDKTVPPRPVTHSPAPPPMPAPQPHK